MLALEAVNKIINEVLIHGHYCELKVYVNGIDIFKNVVKVSFEDDFDGNYAVMLGVK